jgi:hypothetical protein
MGSLKDILFGRTFVSWLLQLLLENTMLLLSIGRFDANHRGHYDDDVSLLVADGCIGDTPWGH